MPPGSSELKIAVNHPLRRQILRVYVDRSLESASAAELAQLTDQQLAKLAYHLRTLVGCGLLRPVGEGEGNGAGGGAETRWALDVEGDWLRLMLDLWAQSDLTG
jgi:DNA-binding transcriptional ArsR family regulator